VAEVPEPGKNTDKVWLRWLSLLRKHTRSGAIRHYLASGLSRAAKQAANSSKNAPDSRLTLQPIGGRADVQFLASGYDKPIALHTQQLPERRHIGLIPA